VSSEAHFITQVMKPLFRVRLHDMVIDQVIRSRLVDFKDSYREDFRVTFIDTPGQDIFFRMRNYGAEIADFAILIVSAEDGVASLYVSSTVYFI
jgi:translation initiation factor IF-2